MAMAPPAAAATSDLAVSNKLLVHRARPGPWTIRKKLMIRVNQCIPNAAHKNLFYYDVSIKPEPKSKAGDKQVLSELINLHGKTTFRDKLPVYDGKSLYTAGQLPFDSEEEFSVTLVDPEKEDNERAEREYKITIRIAGTTDLYHLQQVLRPRQSYVTVPRSFFSITFSHRGNISEGLECWGGYHQILRPTQMGLSLVIDIPATSFLKHATGVQSVPGFLNLRDTSRPLTYMDQIKKKLPGVRVETGFTPIPMS